ncbi:hypothetical protein B484DRAFT_439604, partial [Ochromonadaceae sp. CCMP2298]
VLFLLLVLGLEGSTEVFVRFPQQVVYGSTPPPIERLSASAGQGLVLVFPGAGGPDIRTDALVKSIKRSDEKKGVRRYVQVYDWSKWRGSFLRAAFDGQKVGEAVCSQLARDQGRDGPVSSLHSIGVSVGAFAADSCIKSFNRVEMEREGKRVGGEWGLAERDGWDWDRVRAEVERTGKGLSGVIEE